MAENKELSVAWTMMRGSVQVRHSCAGKCRHRAKRALPYYSSSRREMFFTIPRGMDQSRLIFYTSKEVVHCLSDP